MPATRTWWDRSLAFYERGRGVVQAVLGHRVPETHQPLTSRGDVAGLQHLSDDLTFELDPCLKGHLRL